MAATDAVARKTATRDIVVVGASAGGVEALQRLVAGFTSDLPAAVFVVLHWPAGVTSALPRILRRSGPLEASHAKHGQPIQPGAIYIAPPDRHLILKPGFVELVREASEHGRRPAVDPLFRSAADAYGTRTVGILLSGTLDDGVDGLATIGLHGGTTMVQDPNEAAFPSMPQAALATCRVDHCLPAAEIASLVDRLAREPIGHDVPAVKAAPEEPGTPSGFSCPDCGGSLWEKSNAGRVLYRCRTGHAYSMASLAASQSHAIDEALWTALRAIEEKIDLTGRVKRRAEESGQPQVVAKLERRITLLERQAQTLRRIVSGAAAGRDRRPAIIAG
jgi:two-component system, chemotaxis family, protein-glutamate methylesterase/glutaminase